MTTALLKDAADLPLLRSQVSARTVSRPHALNAYSATISAGYDAITQTILQMANVTIVTLSLAVMRTAESMDMLLQEEALLTSDVRARSFPPADRLKFAELVGTHREILAQAMASLDPVFRSYYSQDVSPRTAAALAGSKTW